ncbi:hypothetical protein [Teichococcus vastitatis]|uniref:Uncharacterized protein n=1 Tax=Teichococcus vastitatis TaxID=2307076 RepID=A0ABS9W601_9PROT|nr:hypothetical protein [Pseudoroseomonas vastitatis]MCI0754711.1 hypothetical protein [Pseudoroseomonas vastitatis]
MMAARRDLPFKGRHFTSEVILWALRWFEGSGLPALAQFLILTLASLLMSMAFHRWLVQPSAVMRMLFNGIPIRRKTTSMGQPASAMLSSRR